MKTRKPPMDNSGGPLTRLEGIPAESDERSNTPLHAVVSSLPWRLCPLRNVSLSSESCQGGRKVVEQSKAGRDAPENRGARSGDTRVDAPRRRACSPFPPLSSLITLEGLKEETHPMLAHKFGGPRIASADSPPVFFWPVRFPDAVERSGRQSRVCSLVDI